MRNAILLAVLLAAATAHADDHNELTLTETNRALRTSSANAVTGDSLIGGALGYARKLDIELVPKLELWATGAFAWGGVDGQRFQTLTTRIDTLAFTVGARARYSLHRLVAASARLDVGTARAALSLNDEMGHSASDHGWGATTQAGLALDFYAIRGSHVTLGLRFELSEVATSSIPLTATPASSSADTLTLEMTAASLGSLNLSGPCFAASFVGQF